MRAGRWPRVDRGVLPFAGSGLGDCSMTVLRACMPCADSSFFLHLRLPVVGFIPPSDSATSNATNMSGERPPHTDAAGASPASPATRLYRHALESVLAFCDLRELASVIGVSKEWVSRPLAGSQRLARPCLHCNSFCHGRQWVSTLGGTDLHHFN
jgi:hypothetical protein